MQSFLAKFQPTSAMSEDELYRKKREAWLDEKILVVTPEQRTKLRNKQLEIINEVGNILYGEKR